MPDWPLAMRGVLVDDGLVDEGSLVEEFVDDGLVDEGSLVEELVDDGLVDGEDNGGPAA